MPTLETLLSVAPKYMTHGCTFGDIARIDFPAEIGYHASWDKADCYSLQCTDADDEQYKLLFAVYENVVTYLGDA